MVFIFAKKENYDIMYHIKELMIQKRKTEYRSRIKKERDHTKQSKAFLRACCCSVENLACGLKTLEIHEMH